MDSTSPTAHLDADLYAEVCALLAGYGHAIDACDAERWADHFHPEGESAGPGRPTLRGRSALVAWVRDNPRPDLLHTCTNVWIRTPPDPDDPTGRLEVVSHFVIYRRDPEGACTVEVLGSYDDHLVRHEGRLVIRRRTAVARSGAPDPTHPQNPARREEQS